MSDHAHCRRTRFLSSALVVLSTALAGCLRTDLVVGLPQHGDTPGIPGETDERAGSDESDTNPGDSNPGDSNPGDSNPGDSDPGDSDPGDSDLEAPPGLGIANLRAAWVTPNYIRWQWDISGDPLHFAAFELVVGASAEVVEERSPAVTVVTSSANPELGYFILPETDPPWLVTQTTSGPLAAGSTLFAQVDIVQDDGTRVRSNTASATTSADSTHEIVLVHDDPPQGYAAPPEYVRSTTAPFAGDVCYEYTSACTQGLDCWENLRWQDLSQSLALLPAASVSGSAYLEVAVALTAAAPAHWSMFALSMEACPSCIYAFESWTLPADGAYHVYQVPLTALRYSGQTLDAATLLSTPLYQIWVGGIWHDGATVRVDEARICW